MKRQAQVEAIFTASKAKARPVRVKEIEAVEGRGLRGDRYAEGLGAFSRFGGAKREVTLITAEALEAADSENGVRVSEGEHRRNIVVRGIELPVLIGKAFSIGDAVMSGVQLCGPCSYLSRVEGQPGLRDALRNRGGIRARVTRSGLIREGDALVPVDDCAPPHLP